MIRVYWLTYCQLKQPPRPDDAEQLVHVLKHGLEHLLERRGRGAHLHARLHADVDLVM